MDHVPYRDWIRAGFLHGCEGDIIDFEAVADAVVQAAQNYDLRMVGFDPYLGATVMQNIRERLAGTVTEVVEIPQGIRSISPPMKELERSSERMRCCMYTTRRHGSVPLTCRCVSDDNENIKPTKSGAADALISRSRGSLRLRRRCCSLHRRWRIAWRLMIGICKFRRCRLWPMCFRLFRRSCRAGCGEHWALSGVCVPRRRQVGQFPVGGRALVERQGVGGGQAVA